METRAGISYTNKKEMKVKNIMDNIVEIHHEFCFFFSKLYR